MDPDATVEHVQQLARGLAVSAEAAAPSTAKMQLESLLWGVGARSLASATGILPLDIVRTDSDHSFCFSRLIRVVF
eukprot:COSAG05_NODE_237_length_13170_cov_25.700558_3_plen_76_part_00